MAGFRDFGALKTLLNASWHVLGQTWAQNGPQNEPKTGPTSCQKMTKMLPENHPKMDPQKPEKICGTLTGWRERWILAQHYEGFRLFFFTSKNGPKPS